MSVAAVRVLIFGVLPLVLAVAHVWLDERVRHRAQRLEVFMLYVLAVGVAGSAIGSDPLRRQLVGGLRLFAVVEQADCHDHVVAGIDGVVGDEPRGAVGLQRAARRRHWR